MRIGETKTDYENIAENVLIFKKKDVKKLESNRSTNDGGIFNAVIKTMSML